MIEVKFRRFESHDGYEYPSLERKLLPSQAVTHILRFELGWGGRVIEATETSLTLRTSCMSKVDVDTYSGTPAEMETLHRAVSIWAQLRGIARCMTDAVADRVQGLVPSVNIVQTVSHIKGGSKVVDLAMARLVDLNETDCKEAMSLGQDVLDPIIQLMLETGAEFRECMEVAA